MDFDQIISKLTQVETLLLAATPLKYRRFIAEEIDLSERLIGIIGPRGVGKTTLLLQISKENNFAPGKSLYFSADTVTLNTGDLFELAKFFYLQLGGRHLLVDEIHKFSNWKQELKNIYDSLPKMQVIFSGSSSTSLLKGKYDLSRRAITYTLPGLSFREYLLFNDIEFPKVTLSNLLLDHNEISRQFSKRDDILVHLKSYMKKGYYPYFLETPDFTLFQQKVLNSINKAIYEDISLQHNIETKNLEFFRKILSFLSIISPGEFSVNKISSNIGKNHVTVSQYLKMLEDAYLVRFLSPKPSPNKTLRSKYKIFLDNIPQAMALAVSSGGQANLGMLRELFIVSHLQNIDSIPHYSEIGDLGVNDFCLEIGGKSKTSKQVKKAKKSLVLADDILVSSGNKIPLYLFGFLY